MKKEKHIFVFILAFLSVISILIGLAYIFYFKNKLSIDSSMVAAWFSLAGVMLFAAALFYQIKEFKLQREELIKSVEAQTNTSNALEEQKNIMLEQKQIALEQKTDAFLMSIIEGYNTFKELKDIQVHINHLISGLNDQEFVRKYSSNKRGEHTISMLAEDLLIIAEDHLQSPSNKPFLKFSWNMLKKIEESIQNYREKDDFFRVYFHNHLSEKETILLLFSELLCENATIGRTVFLKAQTIQKLIDYLPTPNIVILQSNNAAKELLDAFAITEKVKNKNLVF